MIKVLVRVVGHIWTAAIAAHEVVISPDDHLTVPPWFYWLAHDGAEGVGGPDLRAGRFGLALAAMTTLGMSRGATALGEGCRQRGGQKNGFKEQHAISFGGEGGVIQSPGIGGKPWRPGLRRQGARAKVRNGFLSSMERTWRHLQVLKKNLPGAKT